MTPVFAGGRAALSLYNDKPPPPPLLLSTAALLPFQLSRRLRITGSTSCERTSRLSRPTWIEIEEHINITNRAKFLRSPRAHWVLCCNELPISSSSHASFHRRREQPMHFASFYPTDWLTLFPLTNDRCCRRRIHIHSADDANINIIINIVMTPPSMPRCNVSNSTRYIHNSKMARNHPS